MVSHRFFFEIMVQIRHIWQCLIKYKKFIINFTFVYSSIFTGLMTQIGIPMKKYIFILLILCTGLSSIAQRPSKDFKKQFLEGYSELQYGAYAQALKHFEKIEERGEINANVNFNIGLCYLNLLGDKSRAIPYLEKAITDISGNYKEGSYRELQAPPEALFYLAKAYRINVQLDKAIQTYTEYKKQLDDGDVYYHEFVELQIQTCKNAKELISSPIPVKKTNLGHVINDSDDNFNPVITPDGKTMIYTTLQRVYDRELQQETFYEIINYTTKNENGEWAEPQDITSKINSDGYLATVGISADGTQMYFFRDDYGDGNLYKAEKKGYRFTEIEELDRDINSRDWESHISPAPDGKTFYFTSTMKGGKGGRDIYVIEKDSKGKWKDPVNLGRAINTPFDEDCPVISEDGKTLYFCSEAHNSMGGYDIFYSKKNAVGEWTTPLNIGYPINTTDDDIFFMPYKNGKFALFAHRDPDDTFGRKDIYRYQLKFDEGEDVPETEAQELAVVADETDTDKTKPEEKQSETDTTILEETVEESTEEEETPEEPLITETEVKETTETAKDQEPESEQNQYASFDIRGIILLQDNQDTNANFNIRVIDQQTNAMVTSTKASGDGTYSMTVPPGDYLVTFEGPGYKPHQRSVSIPPDYGLPKVTLDVELTPKPVASGEYVLMRGVLFDYNSTQLNREARIRLEKLYKVMNQNPQLYVEVTGFSDPTGNASYNQNLAAKRARNVINYLVNKGISRDRFIAKSKGEQQPLVSANNPNPEAQRYNRRVEINVIKTGDTKITYEEFNVPEHLKFGDKAVQLQYTVLLTDSHKPLSPGAFKKVEAQGVSNVWIFPSVQGYFYTIGKYPSRAKASELVNKAADMGFPNARIINYRELEQKKHQGNIASQKRFEKTSQKDGKYTIQLLALKVPVDISYFKNIEGVERIKGPDGIYRYILGKYDYKTAQRKRKELLENGYAGAFIMNLNYYHK